MFWSLYDKFLLINMPASGFFLGFFFFSSFFAVLGFELWTQGLHLFGFLTKDRNSHLISFTLFQTKCLLWQRADLFAAMLPLYGILVRCGTAKHWELLRGSDPSLCLGNLLWVLIWYSQNALGKLKSLVFFSSSPMTFLLGWHHC
jgi:hypothetical protein